MDGVVGRLQLFGGKVVGLGDATGEGGLYERHGSYVRCGLGTTFLVGPKGNDKGRVGE